MTMFLIHGYLSLYKQIQVWMFIFVCSSNLLYLLIELIIRLVIVIYEDTGLDVYLCIFF